MKSGRIDARPNHAMGAPMLSFLRRMIARLGLAGALVLSLAFLTPAFAAHVCIDPSCTPAEQAISADVDLDDACPDCGPACANGCCHAPHPTAPTADLAAPQASVPLAAPSSWGHTALPPPVRPAGPERPPRA